MVIPILAQIGTCIFLGAELALPLMEDEEQPFECMDGPLPIQLALHVGMEMVEFGLLLNPVFDALIVLCIVPSYRDALTGKNVTTVTTTTPTTNLRQARQSIHVRQAVSR